MIDSLDVGAFRSRLRCSLAARYAHNPRYSLRAFAASLGVHHGTLSQILRAGRTPSARLIRRATARLGPHPAVATADLAPALRALILRPNSRRDTPWLARALGVPIDQINLALFELVRQGELTLTSRRKWTLASPKGA